MKGDGWDGYVAFAGEDLLLVEFQEAATEARLQADLPAILRIELEVVAPDGLGQPSKLEARQLNHEQKQLVALLARHETGGRLVARATVRGTRELVLALPEEGRADYVLRKWSRKLERECAYGASEAGWSFVSDHLLPGQAERTWMAARNAVFSLLEAGADPQGMAVLKLQGQPGRPMALDPFAVASALAEVLPETPWTLELP